jgi:hypothetical protein
LAASPAIIQKHYESNKSYQRPPVPVEKRVVQDIYDHSKFHDYLGTKSTTMTFSFSSSKKSTERVGGGDQRIRAEEDDRADDMLARMFAGGFLSESLDQLL